MKSATLLVLIALVAAPLFAQRSDCRAVDALDALYDLRALIIRGGHSEYEMRDRIDRHVDEMRGPLPEGGFRWVRYVRPSGDGPVVKKGHTVVAVHDRDDADSYDATSDHAFAVRVAVPQKKSLFGANNAVYVGKVHIEYSIDGRTKSLDKTINAWMAPDTAKTYDLGGIAERTSVAIEASTEAKTVREALVEIHFVQAVSEDDPDGPDYETIRVLRRVRSNPDAYKIESEIASLEHMLFPHSEPFPVSEFITALRRADKMMKSEKPDEQEKGRRLMKDTLRRVQ